MHAGTASDDVQKRLLSSYDVNLKDFRSSMRTVGVGTNIVFKDGCGSKLTMAVPMVGRTETGPDGTVGLGKQSRAAGGAYGDLALSGMRELSEEFICAHDNKTGELVVYNLLYKEPFTDFCDVEGLIAEKNLKSARILKEYGRNDRTVRFENLTGIVMAVEGLTQSITQIIDGDQTEITNRIVTDNPSAGDVAGVDTVVLAQLPSGASFSTLIVLDGEEDFDGDLLKRHWSLRSPEAWKSDLASGMPMSPAPKKVFDNWGKAENAIRAHL